PRILALGNLSLADGLVRFLPGYQRPGAIEGVRLGIPVVGDVAIAIEGDERLRPRFDGEARHQGEVPAGGMADDGDALWIDLEELRTLPAHPREGVAHVLDDAGEFGFRGEAVVDGDHDEAGVDVALALGGVHAAALAADEGAAVN